MSLFFHPSQPPSPLFSPPTEREGGGSAKIGLFGASKTPRITQFWLSVCLCLMSISLAACQTRPKPLALTVFAAASLTDAMTELGGAFMAEHPGVQVIYNFAGSQQLAQQLAHGAPADVFASANQAQMETAIASGRVAAGAARTFAHNRLVVVYPEDNPAELASLLDLARPGIKLVLAAGEVPVGAYSMHFLENASLEGGYGASYREAVLANVVSYEENVHAVYSKVALGEADAGIVYATDIPRDNPDGVGVLEIPQNINIMAEYPIAVIQDSVQPKQADAFLEFVLSPPGQDILSGYGFIPKK